MSSSSEEETIPKRRRGISHESTYKRNVIRTARVKGESYVTYTGKQVPKKSIPIAITYKCLSKCYLHLNGENIHQIWNHFYSFENKNTQDTHLQSWIEIKEIKRRRPGNGNNPTQQGKQNMEDDIEEEDLSHANESESILFKKNHSFNYYLRINGEFKRVCKNVFIEVHGISADRVRRICKLLVEKKKLRVTCEGKTEVVMLFRETFALKCMNIF